MIPYSDNNPPALIIATTTSQLGPEPTIIAPPKVAEEQTLLSLISPPKVAEEQTLLSIQPGITIQNP
uniref:Uncharacterized protein n=1 Tax=Arundo donax TaxID=35708 RepID=A0A0A9FJ72_ARUDO